MLLENKHRMKTYSSLGQEISRFSKFGISDIAWKNLEVDKASMSGHSEGENVRWCLKSKDLHKW